MEDMRRGDQIQTDHSLLVAEPGHHEAGVVIADLIVLYDMSVLHVHD